MHIYAHTCTHNHASDLNYINTILIYALDQNLSHNQLAALQLMNLDLHNKEEHVHICKSELGKKNKWRCFPLIYQCLLNLLTHFY